VDFKLFTYFYHQNFCTVLENASLWYFGGFVAQIGLKWDSLHESSLIAGHHEQLDTDKIQDLELA